MKLRGSATVVVAAGMCLSLMGPATAAPSVASAASSHGTGVSDRNRVERAGNVPQWVQMPYLVRDGRRSRIVAKFYVDPLRTQPSGNGRVDRLSMQVTVAKPAAVREGNRSVACFPPARLCSVPDRNESCDTEV